MASLINIFFASSMMSFVISIVSILIFSGLIAYDNQLIKKVYYGANGQVTDGWQYLWRLGLYLDFINLILELSCDSLLDVISKKSARWLI